MVAVRLMAAIISDPTQHRSKIVAAISNIICCVPGKAEIGEMGFSASEDLISNVESLVFAMDRVCRPHAKVFQRAFGPSVLAGTVGVPRDEREKRRNAPSLVSLPSLYYSFMTPRC